MCPESSLRRTCLTTPGLVGTFPVRVTRRNRPVCHCELPRSDLQCRDLQSCPSGSAISRAIPENAPTTGAVLIHHATSFDDNDLLNQVPNPPVRRALMSARSVPTTGLEPNEMETKEERLYYKESAGRVTRIPLGSRPYNTPRYLRLLTRYRHRKSPMMLPAHRYQAAVPPRHLYGASLH